MSGALEGADDRRRKERERSRRRYAADREREIARCAAWNRANKERVNATAAERRAKRQPVNVVLWWNARNRAKARGIEFSLTYDDIDVPSHCPVLGIPLAVQNGSAGDNSPSLDRLDPQKGYVRGNVAVISHKANTIKSNATIADLRAVLAFMEKNA